MADRRKGGDVFIVDNSDSDWKVRNYLHDWADLAHTFDVATGYFEIGALLALDGQWQKLDHMRILMGDEVSKRTKKALLAGIEGIKSKLDDSIEREKEANDFLRGVPGIVEAVRAGKIQCRVYTKDKFHAKAFITHGKLAVVGSVALVGSSNFTYPGLTENVELNVIARQFNGAFLCDGVGLGKTFIGMMLIEHLTMHDRQRVALFVPKAARKSVWEATLNKYLLHVRRGDFANLVIYNHTDLQRGGEYAERMQALKGLADVIVIDEAHHFRNPGLKGIGERGPSRYRQLFDIAEGKALYMLTATPINN